MSQAVRILLSVALLFSWTQVWAQDQAKLPPADVIMNLAPNDQSTPAEILAKMDQHQLDGMVRSLNPKDTDIVNRRMRLLAMKSLLQPVSIQEIVMESQAGVKTATLGGAEIVVILAVVALVAYTAYTACLITHREDTATDTMKSCLGFADKDHSSSTIR